MLSFTTLHYLLHFTIKLNRYWVVKFNTYERIKKLNFSADIYRHFSEINTNFPVIEYNWQKEKKKINTPFNLDVVSWRLKYTIRLTIVTSIIINYLNKLWVI